MVLNYIKTYIVVLLQNARGFCMHCIYSIRESRYTPSTLAALVQDISSIYTKTFNILFNYYIVIHYKDENRDNLRLNN